MRLKQPGGEARVPASLQTKSYKRRISITADHTVTSAIATVDVDCQRRQALFSAQGSFSLFPTITTTAYMDPYHIEGGRREPAFKAYNHRDHVRGLGSIIGCVCTAVAHLSM